MKRLLIFLVPVMFFILSCNSSDPSPQEVGQFIVDISENKIDNVKKALKKSPKIKYWTFDVGNGITTPLDVAIYSGNDEIIKIIADKHNATLASEPLYETPLMFALERGCSTECIEYLMTFNQKYDAVDCKNNNIIHFFARNRKMNIDTWNLIKAKITPDMINQKNDGNISPIQRIVYTVVSQEMTYPQDALTIFNDLLDLGAKSDDLFEKASIEECKNIPWLELLIRTKNNQYIEAMLNHSAVPIPNFGDYSSYANVAYHYDNYEIIPAFIPYLKDINLCTKKNETILFWAACSTAIGYTDKNLIKIIIDLGADTSIINDEGYTAYSAYVKLCETPDEEILELLKTQKY